MTKEQLYYLRHRDEILARSKARYRTDPHMRERLVASNRRRRRLERIAERWIREWIGQ